MAKEMEKNNNRILLGLYNFSVFRRLAELANSNFRVMNWSRFEYFLNAIHSCLWCGTNRGYERIEKNGYKILKFFLTNKQYEALLKRQQKYAPLNKKALYDIEGGVHIGWANTWFGYFYSCYFGWIDIF